MKNEEWKRLPPFERLVEWIRERERIRVKRSFREPPPWTDNEALRTYRFCNVRRMDDKVSQWLLTNWYRPNRNHPNVVVAAALARHFNLPHVLQAIGFPKVWEPERIKTVVRELKVSGKTVFNSAYMVRGIESTDKTEMVVDWVCQPLVGNPPAINGNSMEASVAALLPYWGFSSFMAGQVVADLRWAMSGSWSDRNDWAPIGPGSKRGMNRLHERPKDKPLDQGQFLEELRELRPKLIERLPNETKRLEAMDFQNCLCEFDKMERVLSGEGKPKNLYRGGHATQS